MNFFFFFDILLMCLLLVCSKFLTALRYKQEEPAISVLVRTFNDYNDFQNYNFIFKRRDKRDSFITLNNISRHMFEN